MRAPRTLSLYIVREVLQYALLGLAAITVVLVARNLVRVLDEVIGAGFLLSDFLTVLRLLVTMLASYAMPIAFLFGVLLAVGRMAGDVEIVAMRACGVSLFGIVAPIALLGVAISGLHAYLSMQVEPAAQRQLGHALFSMIARGASIVPGQFSMLGGRLVYVQQRDRNQLKGIVLAERSDPHHSLMIFAESGQMDLDEQTRKLTLALDHGEIHVDPPSNPFERYQRISFQHFDYTLDMSPLLGPASVPRAREMTMSELRDVVRRLDAGEVVYGLREADPITYALHLYRRIAAPMSSTLFALVGVPLAMRRTRGARSWGVLLSAAVAFLYYMLQSFSEFFALREWISPALALWLPNAAFALLAAVLLSRARRAA